mmetsp:Transcript_4562/g.17970  ORF Transcript_4562/g.17970 Transcript_4562/m.17970 type:complete len:430 (-) Transcript_4562:3013-4302(-)
MRERLALVAVDALQMAEHVDHDHRVVAKVESVEDRHPHPIRKVLTRRLAASTLLEGIHVVELGKHEWHGRRAGKEGPPHGLENRRNPGLGRFQRGGIVATGVRSGPRDRLRKRRRPELQLHFLPNDLIHLSRVRGGDETGLELPLFEHGVDIHVVRNVGAKGGQVVTLQRHLPKLQVQLHANALRRVAAGLNHGIHRGGRGQQWRGSGWRIAVVDVVWCVRSPFLLLPLLPLLLGLERLEALHLGAHGDGRVAPDASRAFDPAPPLLLDELLDVLLREARRGCRHHGGDVQDVVERSLPEVPDALNEPATQKLENLVDLDLSHAGHGCVPGEAPTRRVPHVPRRQEVDGADDLREVRGLLELGVCEILVDRHPMGVDGRGDLRVLADEVLIVSKLHDLKVKLQQVVLQERLHLREQDVVKHLPLLLEDR